MEAVNMEAVDALIILIWFAAFFSVVAYFDR